MVLISYAQNYEDVMLWRALGHIQHGFFIDIGAMSPELHSVTKAFSDRGWRGINVEPNPRFHAQLVEQRPSETNLKVAVGERAGRTLMSVIEDTGLSTADPEIAEKHRAAGWSVVQEEVEVTTLAAIWDAHVPLAQDVHFLKIDVEGYERAVLAGNDWQRHRPWIVVIEATLPLSQVESHDQWESLLTGAGYVHCYADGLNRYYVAQEHEELRDAFKFPPNVFDGFVAADVAKERTLAEAADARAAESVGLVEVMRQELSVLRERIEAIQSRSIQSERREAETVQRARIQVADLRTAVHARDQQIAEANQRAAEALQQQKLMLQSTSWRLTAPLRRLAPLVPASVRRYARRLLKAGWWALTPHRLPQRLRSLRERHGEAKILGEGSEIDGTAEPQAPTKGDYAQWIRDCELRSDAVELKSRDDGRPVVSFLVWNVRSASELAKTLASMPKQPGKAWEVLVGHGDAFDSEAVLASSRLAGDSRATLVSALSGTEAECLNILNSKAQGLFVAVLDAGDVLAQHALSEIAYAIDRAPDADIFYSDEDKQSENDFREEPYFKPGWSPDLLYAFNYFGRLTLLRRTLVTQAGGVDAESASAAEWDLNLRVSDLAQRIRHIPKVLCHRKPSGGRGRSIASDAEVAASSGVIARYWARHGFAVEAIAQEDGTQRVTWSMEPPLVSIVIVITGDAGAESLVRQADTLISGTDYSRKEIIVVVTASCGPATLASIEQLEEHGVRSVRFRKDYSEAAARNFGASLAFGEFLLFLDESVEIVSGRWLQEMVCFALRPGVGVVGAKLVAASAVESNETGLLDQLCAPMFNGAAIQEEWGIFGSPNLPRNRLTVPGASLLVRRDVFGSLGQFDESYLGVLSSAAFCLKLWEAGYRTVCASHVCLRFHAAGASVEKLEADMSRLANTIRHLGIEEDPFLHPELDGTAALPTLRTRTSSTVKDELEKYLRTHASALLSNQVLNLADVGACMAAVRLPRDQVIWSPQPADKILDKWSAARWCLDLLRTSNELRVRFPHALSAGLNGEFARWLRANGEVLFGFSDVSLTAIEAVFSEDISKNARQLFMFRADVRAELPHGLTPPGQRELFKWFIHFGRQDAELRLEEIWWLFWQASEQPEQELVRCYLFTPTWQRHYPDAMTVFGRRAFARWFSATYQAEGRWTEPSQWPLPASADRQLRQAYQANDHWQKLHPYALENRGAAEALIDWLQSAESMQTAEVQDWCKGLDKRAVAQELVAPGLNVLGHFCYPSGLRVSVEAIVNGLEKVGVATSLRDVRTDKKDDPEHFRFDGLEDFDITLIHAQPEPFFDDVYEKVDLAQRVPRPYRIAYWYWEFDSIPESWISHAATVDEVWTATEFVAKGLKERLSIPVRTFFPGVSLAPYKQRDRSYFGLEDGKFTFLFTFHMMSVMERKNPLGLINAFQKAFGPDEAVSLVLKTSFGDRHPREFEKLCKAVTGRNIKIINQIYSQDEVLSLMDACDAYVSLHRSEGLGLTMAEAMLMGKPVIATSYSGNVDFMDESNSLLVPHTLKKLGRPIPPYDANAEWAEPSIDHAAQLMRRLFEEQDWAREIGARGKASAERNLSLEAAGQRISARLDEIRALRKPT